MSISMLSTFKKMINGIDPLTNKRFINDHFIMDPNIQYLLNDVAYWAELGTRRVNRQWAMAKQRTKWSIEDIKQLKEAFEDGLPINLLAIIFQRNENAILKQLHIMKLYQYNGPSKDEDGYFYDIFDEHILGCHYDDPYNRPFRP